MGSVCLLSSWQFPTGPILFSKYGTENPGEEKSVFPLSGGQQTDQCVAASAQLTEAQCAQAAAFPFQLSPIQVPNRCKNPARPALLAAHRTSLKS